MKQTSLSKFDNDNDFFYPFIKDEIVENNRTFRDVLLNYTSEDTLLAIEEALPLLNIYIPDLSIITEFNAENWDINDNEVAVTPLTNSAKSTFYGNGHEDITLSEKEIPGFPCIIVKDNERLKLKSGIKVKGAHTKNDYEFIDKAFDGRYIATKGDRTTSPRVPPARTTASYPQIVTDAAQEFGVDKQYWQRDYIYYNMTKTNPKDGIYNPQIRENMMSFILDKNVFKRISDQDGDPQTQEYMDKSDNPNPTMTYDALIKKLWSDGRFEINFLIFKGRKTEDQISPQSYTISVSPTELFSVGYTPSRRGFTTGDYTQGTVIVHRVKHKGLFHRNRHYYTIDPTKLIPLRYSINNGVGIPLEKWDISTESMSMLIKVQETDPDQTVEKTETVTNQYSNSLNFKIDVGAGSLIKKVTKLDLSFGYSSQKSETKQQTLKVTTTLKSDDLGTLTFYFSDPVLLSNGGLYEINSGSINLGLLPKPIQ